MKRLNLCTFQLLAILYSAYAVSLEIEGTLQDDVNDLRKKVKEDVLNHMNEEFGWSHGETPRAIIALALQNDTFFQAGDIFTSVTTKQLKLEILEVLFKWPDQPLSAGQLALFINALLATCNDPYNFFGVNLVLRLWQMTTTSEYEKSLHSLTLCNAGEKLPKSTILHLSSFLNETEFIYGLDTQAMALMAILCANDHFQITYLRPVRNEVLISFLSKQKNDGSFGNIYTTALVIQALIAADYDEDMRWFRQAFDYFKYYYEDPNETHDLLSHYFVLPTLNFKSMAHLKKHCKFASGEEKQNLNENDLSAIILDENEVIYLYENSSKENEDNLIAVSYTLWYQGKDRHNDSFSTIVIIKDGETLLDVMKRAAKADAKYHFHTKQFSFGTAIESLAGLVNNETDRIYWMIYKIEILEMMPKMVTKSVEYIKPKDGDHFLLWYHKV